MKSSENKMELYTEGIASSMRDFIIHASILKFCMFIFLNKVPQKTKHYMH